MPSLYPIDGLRQIKIKGLLQELKELKDQLECFREFTGFDELSLKAQRLLNAEENIKIEEVTTCINKINSFIKLNWPIVEKFNQIIFLNNLIAKYCEQNEVQGLNSALAILKKKLKTEIAEDPIDPKKIEEHISQIDLSFHENLKKILEKIKQGLLKKSLDLRFDDYRTDLLGLISKSKEEINKKPIKISGFFYSINAAILSINKFESSHESFLNLQYGFNEIIESHHKLTETLLNSNAVASCKDQVEQQIEILSKKFAEFDPRLNSLEIISDSLQELGQKLNDLHQLNLDELQKQQDIFIKLIEDSKQTLIGYAEKLSLLKSKCAHNKSEQLNIIIQKIDLLLNPEINQEDNPSNQAMIDNILELKQTIDAAKGILSEYRGISLLRCFATLWGGGKVTSQSLVSTLEEQLANLQSNITMISPNL